MIKEFLAYRLINLGTGNSITFDASGEEYQDVYCDAFCFPTEEKRDFFLSQLKGLHVFFFGLESGWATISLKDFEELEENLAGRNLNLRDSQGAFDFFEEEKEFLMDEYEDDVIRRHGEEWRKKLEEHLLSTGNKTLTTTNQTN